MSKKKSQHSLENQTNSPELFESGRKTFLWLSGNAHERSQPVHRRDGRGTLTAFAPNSPMIGLRAGGRDTNGAKHLPHDTQLPEGP